MSALEHDALCRPRTVLIGLGIEEMYCRCAERALTASRQREEEATSSRAVWKDTAERFATRIARLEEENDRLTLAASESARTLQVEIERLKYSLESADIACEQHGKAIDTLVGENHALKAQVTALREALRRAGYHEPGRCDLVGHGMSRWAGDHCAMDEPLLAAFPQDGA